MLVIIMDRDEEVPIGCVIGIYTLILLIEQVVKFCAQHPVFVEMIGGAEVNSHIACHLDS